MSVSVIFPFLILIFLVIPVLICVFVYRDARSRGMNAALWTIVVLFAPLFVGLIVYLIVREGTSAARCPGCGERVAEDFAVCPQCGMRLQGQCPNCGFFVQPQWRACPKCATPLEPSARPSPVRKKDRSLRVVLICLILVPLLLAGGVILSLYLFNTPSGSSLSLSYGGIDRESYAGNTVVTDWLEKCDETGDGIYLLSYSYTDGGDILLYRTGDGYDRELSVDSSSKSISFVYGSHIQSGEGYSLYSITYSGAEISNYNITNGEDRTIPVTCTESSEPLTPAP